MPLSSDPMFLMVRVALDGLWVCSKCPGFTIRFLSSESISCFHNQLTLPVTSRKQTMVTLKFRFLAMKRGNCQIEEQMPPVGDKARIKTHLSQPLAGGQPYYGRPSPHPCGWRLPLAQPPGLSLLPRVRDHQEALASGSGAT